MSLEHGEAVLKMENEPINSLRQRDTLKPDYAIRDDSFAL